MSRVLKIMGCGLALLVAAAAAAGIQWLLGPSVRESADRQTYMFVVIVSNWLLYTIAFCSLWLAWWRLGGGRSSGLRRVGVWRQLQGSALFCFGVFSIWSAVGTIGLEPDYYMKYSMVSRAKG